MARKTKEDACITRNHILDAAVECFGKQGVSRTSLNDIARQAGVTRGAIYWHFSNRGELFVAMVERLVCPLILQSEEYFRQMMTADPLGFIRASTLGFFDKLTHDANFYRVFEILWHKCEYVGEMADIRKRHLDEGEKHIDILQQAFIRMRQNGQLSSRLTPHQATIALISLVDGLIFNWTKSNRLLFPLESYGRPILNAFLDSLQTGEGRRF
ncbi:MAG: TetR family transcriptional regulator [Zoogloeaceae bacterium]|jgi:TetR/AcrR family acrAB operon transcriptional repressor|nr:TetR family transcriptional regulator [Zoogloeaceae bacterium]